MSNVGQGEREWRFYVDDMIAFAQKVLSDDIPAFLAALQELKQAHP